LESTCPVSFTVPFDAATSIVASFVLGSLASVALTFCIKLGSFGCVTLAAAPPIGMGMGPEGAGFSCAKTTGESASAAARVSPPTSVLRSDFITNLHHFEVNDGEQVQAVCHKSIGAIWRLKAA
jgi:hypothetical protein